MAYAFSIDESTGEAVDRLKGVYGVYTRAQVLRRALALAIVSARHVGPDGILRLRDMRPDAAPDATVEIDVRG